MSSTTKRAWKLQEFVAHGGNVNCLALGKKSGRVMVTGGVDKKVNMWAIGKPNCIMSLSGHTSPIEAVRFGNAEEMVVAGSVSGALKIWDLEAAKIVRTLTGHKSNIRTLDFHPYGEFVGSGSLDTNIKLWDIRRKGCIFTYKGHTQCVNSIRFSPDGRWIASAGEDGLLKLWDLTAGKLLTDFRMHTGPLTAVEFHPTEFLLASGSSDRTVKFWDLESFKLVSSTDGDSMPFRTIFFHPDGACLYAAAQDQMKVYGWEPARTYDSIQMTWGRVSDIAIAHNQLIGATFSQTNVSTFVADISRIQPLGGDVYSSTTPHVASPPMSASGRRSYIAERPPTQSTKQAPLPPQEEPEEPSGGGDDDASGANDAADIQDAEDYNHIFRPKQTLSHSPPRDVQPFPAPPDEGTAPEPVKVTRPPTVVTSSNQKSTTNRHSAPRQPAPAAAPPTANTRVSPTPPPASVPASTPAPAVAPAPFRPPPATPISQPSWAPQPAPAPARQPAPAPTRQPAPARAGNGVNAEDFLPQQMDDLNLAGGGGGVQKSMSEADAVGSIMKGHDSMAAVMNSRLKNLQIVRALYTSGSMKHAVDSAIGMNDKAIIVDLLNVMVQRHSLWTLNLCATLLPQISDLLNSKYENYCTSACGALKVILQNFASVIKANITAPPSVGVDITREERYTKCKECYLTLVEIQAKIGDHALLNGKHGTKFREIQLLMGQLA